jgi:predicted nucleic acid-binding protein
VNAKQAVIDASVALKWRLRDEEATSQADALPYEIEHYDFRGIQNLAFQLASQHKRSVYDGAYLALA